MADVFKTALQNALRAQYGMFTTLAVNTRTTAQGLTKTLRRPDPLPRDEARQLAHLTTQELNQAIETHAKKIRELRQLGQELREAFIAEYVKED